MQKKSQKSLMQTQQKWGGKSQNLELQVEFRGKFNFTCVRNNSVLKFKMKCNQII